MLCSVDEVGIFGVMRESRFPLFLDMDFTGEGLNAPWQSASLPTVKLRCAWVAEPPGVLSECCLGVAELLHRKGNYNSCARPIRVAGIGVAQDTVALATPQFT